MPAVPVALPSPCCLLEASLDNFLMQVWGCNTLSFPSTLLHSRRAHSLTDVGFGQPLLCRHLRSVELCGPPVPCTALKAFPLPWAYSFTGQAYRAVCPCGRCSAVTPVLVSPFFVPSDSSAGFLDCLQVLVGWRWTPACEDTL